MGLNEREEVPFWLSLSTSMEEQEEGFVCESRTSLQSDRRKNMLILRIIRTEEVMEHFSQRKDRDSSTLS